MIALHQHYQGLGDNLMTSPVSIHADWCTWRSPLHVLWSFTLDCQHYYWLDTLTCMAPTRSLGIRRSSEPYFKNTAPAALKYTTCSMCCFFASHTWFIAFVVDATWWTCSECNCFLVTMCHGELSNLCWWEVAVLAKPDVLKRYRASMILKHTCKHEREQGLRATSCVRLISAIKILRYVWLWVRCRWKQTHAAQKKHSKASLITVCAVFTTYLRFVGGWCRLHLHHHTWDGRTSYVHVSSARVPTPHLVLTGTE